MRKFVSGVIEGFLQVRNGGPPVPHRQSTVPNDGGMRFESGVEGAVGAVGVAAGEAVVAILFPEVSQSYMFFSARRNTQELK